MHYLDTSAAVALFIPETASALIRAFAERQADGLATSAWVSTEVASALSIKVRTRALTSGQRARVTSEWRLFRQGLADCAIEPAMFRTAELWVEKAGLALRAGDALHLAVAAAHGCTLVTLDERMAKAAPELGVPVTAI